MSERFDDRAAASITLLMAERAIRPDRRHDKVNEYIISCYQVAPA